MQFWHKSLVLFWTATLLVSTTCFGADVHFCEGEVQSFALFDTAKPCNMHTKKAVKKEVPTCCMARKTQPKQLKKGFPIVENGKCCYNDQVAFKTDGEQGGQSLVSGVQQHVKLATFSVRILPRIHIVTPNKTKLFRGPPEHPTPSNFQVLYQVFRI